MRPGWADDTIIVVYSADHGAYAAEFELAATVCALAGVDALEIGGSGALRRVA